MRRILALISAAVCILAIAQAITLAQAKPPAAAGSAWQIRTIKSEMDDSPGVVYTASASNIISGWLKTYRPTLFIRCQERRLQAYVDFGMAAAVESGDSRTVRIRFDEGTAETEYWDESTDNEALFVSDPGEFVQSVVKARLLRVQFTPFNASPQIARFNIAGFARHLPELTKRCGPPQTLEERVTGMLATKDSPTSPPAVTPPPPSPPTSATPPAPVAPEPPKPPVAAREFVRLALNGASPYHTALFHQQTCDWIMKSAGGTLTLWRDDAERAAFRPHHACMKTTPGPEPILPVKPLSGRNDPRNRETVVLNVGPPSANGFYHTLQCTLYPAGFRRSTSREDAERRYYVPHPECIDRGAQ